MGVENADGLSPSIPVSPPPQGSRESTDKLHSHQPHTAPKYRDVSLRQLRFVTLYVCYCDGLVSGGRPLSGPRFRIASTRIAG